MLLNLVSVIALVLLVIFVPVFLLFLPAIVELIKPKDSGPRMIEENAFDVLFRPNGVVRIVKIDEDQRLDSLIVGSMTRIIEVFPNLEA